MTGRVEHFKFDVNDKVLIREIQRPGVIKALTVDYLGVQYMVAFWDNAERKSAWLFADDLDARA